MSENNIVLTELAASLIKSDVAAFKRDGKRYADYVVEMEVTPETVAAHVAMFRDAFKKSNPRADGDEIKAYATKVRNGLNRWAGKKEGKKNADWLTLLRQAATNANVKGEVPWDTIATVVADMAVEASKAATLTAVA